MSLLCLAAVLAALAASSALTWAASSGADVKVTVDNNNVDGGTPTPSFDAQNRQANETTVAVSPVNPSLVAAGANDYRMVTVTGDVWFGLYVSQDAGATWFNTMVPGFPSDSSASGSASPLKGLDGSGDPVVRFDAGGNLYVAGIAYNRNFDKEDKPLDTVVYVARYDYTPGTPAGTSTANAAGNPPNFTYARTTVVDRGAVGFAVPNPPGIAGTFVDKEWMEIDRNPAANSACAGNIYVSFTSFHGYGLSSPMTFSRSGDGGQTFSRVNPISTGGASGSASTQGSDIAVGADGTVYVAYHAYNLATGTDFIQIVSSPDCGKHWGKPVNVAAINTVQAPGVAFRTPTFAFVAADDTDANVVYVAYQDFVGDYDVYVQRSSDRGATWGPRVRMNEDPGSKHQVFPTIDIYGGTLHAAWYDFRNSTTALNEALDVYYAACPNCKAGTQPVFGANLRVSDVSHNGNCRLFGGGTAAFHGDYIELDAGAGAVQIAWADNRDVTPCDLDPAPGPASNNTGNRNQNIYADTIVP